MGKRAVPIFVLGEWVRCPALWNQKVVAMNRLLVGWVALWIGLLLTVVSGRHAAGYFLPSPALAAIQGGAPAPQPAPSCAALACDCKQACFWDGNTNTCQTCVNPIGGTTTYVCCQPTQKLGLTCTTTINTAQCGALTNTPANNPPFGGGGPAGPCQDANLNLICINATGNDPACKTYFTVDPKSNGCP
jgi:hypothetical protein